MKKVLDDFIAIPLQKGNNEIILTYTSPGLKTGAIITGAGIIGFVLFLLVEKRKKIKYDNISCTLLYRFYLCIWYGAVVIIYMVPIGYTLFVKLLTH